MPRYKILVTVKAAFSQYYASDRAGRDMVFDTYEAAKAAAVEYNAQFHDFRFAVVEA